MDAGRFWPCFISEVPVIIKDERMMDRFRMARLCEHCQRPVGPLGTPAHPHHVFGRGHGGGKRLDLPIALISLCFWCHQAHHEGKEPLTITLIALVAQREGVLQQQIKDAIRDILRLPKGSPREAVEALIPKRNR